MEKIRIRYCKEGKAAYISHLDLMTTMQRTFIRAGVSLKYSEGFNPHPYISVALPLPVGTESICELMDAALIGGTVPDRINDFMPEGLRIQTMYRAWRGFGEIKWVEIMLCLYFDLLPPHEIDSVIKECLSQKNLIITKKTKRGISTIDIAPHIRDINVFRESNNCITLSAKLSAQNPTVSGKDIVGVIDEIYENKCKDMTYFNHIELKRIEIYDSNMILFK